MTFSTKQMMRWAGAVVVLAMLALAASCTGFFVNPTWTAITIQPPNPTVAVGYQETLTAWGTDTNGNRSQVTSNLVWDLSGASNGGTVATLNASTGVLTGVAAGTVTVTASAEGISGTATATVAENVSSMTITPANQSVTDDGSSFATYTVTSGSTNLSSLVTLTAYQNGTAVTEITCAYDSATNTQQCTPASGLVATGASQTYSIVVTYAGYTGLTQVQATLVVNGPA